MTKICGKKGHHLIDICPAVIPPQYRCDRECMTQVLDTRSVCVGGSP
jgi:hypothetical protein